MNERTDGGTKTMRKRTIKKDRPKKDKKSKANPIRQYISDPPADNYLYER